MDRGSGVFIKYGVATLSLYYWSLSMTVALPLTAGRNLSWDLFSSRTSKQHVVWGSGCQESCLVWDCSLQG